MKVCSISTYYTSSKRLSGYIFVLFVNLFFSVPTGPSQGKHVITKAPLLPKLLINNSIYDFENENAK